MLINGNIMTRAYTLNTMYADNNIELVDEKGVLYRISADVLLELIKQKTFIATLKRKYYHLTLN